VLSAFRLTKLCGFHERKTMHKARRIVPTSVPTPPAVQRLVEATNSADSAAFVGSFTDDGVVDDWGREFVGHEAISGWNERENIGVQSHFTFHQVTKDNGTYTARVTVQGNGYNGGGTFTFELRDDRVSRFVIR
jgi:hypothetical protein